MVGQAYHWFTQEGALPQIHRVLREEGIFAPIWNVRDDRTEWVGALSAIVGSEGYGLENAWQYGSVEPWFSEPELGLTEHAVTIPTDRLVDLVRSRSYYLNAEEHERARLEREIGELTATNSAVAVTDSIEMPYRTCVYRMRRQSG